MVLRSGGVLKEFLGGDLLLRPWKPYPIPDLMQLKFSTPYYAKRKVFEIVSLTVFQKSLSLFVTFDITFRGHIG